MGKDKTDDKPKTSWAALPDAERDSLYRRALGGADVGWLAEEVGIKFPTFSRRLREWGQSREHNRPVMATGKFEDHWNLLCKLIGRDVKRPIPRYAKKAGANQRRVAVICDFHGWPQKELVAEVVDYEPDLVLLDGDVFDAFAFSHWEKDHDSPIQEEIARVRAVLELFQSKGIQTKMNSGNHDDRAKKYFARRIDPAFMPLCQYNLLELAALNLPSVTVVHNVYDFTTGAGRVHAGALHNNWLIHEGDALIGHAETANKGELRSVDKLADWVHLWGPPLGWGPVRLLLQAHVHRAGIGYPAGGNLVRVEGGFAGDLAALQYTHDYGTTMYTPPAVGFTTFRQNKVGDLWTTDLNSVWFHLC